MLTIIIGIVGFIMGFTLACCGFSLMTVGTILLDKDDTLYVELENVSSQEKINTAQMVVFRIKRR